MSTNAPRRLRPLFCFAFALLASGGALASPSTSVKPYGAKSVVPSAVSSLADDMLLREAKRCTAYFGLMESRTGIPAQLLGSIAVAESGRWHDGLNIRIPWPWTINAEGKGQYFTTKAEAIRTVRQLQAKGVKSIDIGCMQVNLVHHAHAFDSLDQAFDPYYNISYAAKFLRGNFDDTRSWPKAVAHYHSQTPERGGPYSKRVMTYWREHLLRARMLTGNAYSPLLAGFPAMDAVDDDGQSEKERAREAALAERRKSKIIVVGTDGKSKTSVLESTSHGVKVVRGLSRNETNAEPELAMAAPAEPAPAKTARAAPAVKRIGAANPAPATSNNSQAPHVVIADVSPQLSLMRAMSEQAKQVSLSDYKPKLGPSGLGPKVIRVTPSSEALLRRSDTKFVFEN